MSIGKLVRELMPPDGRPVGSSGTSWVRETKLQLKTTTEKIR
jgi:hypothetical protein